jgi:Thioredoxin domain-containing protein
MLRYAKEKELPVVMDFWGPQCVPCMGLMPHYMEMAKEFEGKAKFTKVDCSVNKRVAMGIPGNGIFPHSFSGRMGQK